MSFPLSSHAAVSVRVALEPVYNVLNTFSLLTSAEHMIGLNTWVIGWMPTSQGIANR